MNSFDAFRTVARSAKPVAAVVLGSGLGSVVGRVTVKAEIPFVAVPGYPAPTVHGHGGRLLLGDWGRVPVLLFQGRAHFYEGHAWERCLTGVRLAADLGVNFLLLTNAAGGIRADLPPGSLMGLSHHLELLDPADWRKLASGGPRESVFDAGLLADLTRLAAAAGNPLPTGTYAALTGPCYETPAEIRALKAAGADTVGMSTAREAVAGHALGLRVAGLSCVTNWAAGLSAGVLDHKEVLENASAPAVRVGDLLGGLIGA